MYLHFMTVERFAQSANTCQPFLPATFFWITRPNHAHYLEIIQMTIQWLLELGSWLWGKSKDKRLEGYILIVEDNADDAALLNRCLAKHKLRATITNTAEGALALIERNSIKAAFIDLRLTFMPGWKLIPLIRNRSPGTLVIVLCGEVRDIENITEAHVWPIVIIKKPPTVDTIERLLAHLKT